MSKGHSDRLTLQQYLQAQKIKRRLQQRNRSRSRGRGSNFQDEQQTSMQSIFQQMNNFLGEAKLDLSELFATTTSKEKILVQTLAKLDKFVLQLKEEIKKMYRDVYTLYMIEHEEAKTGKDESNRIYFEQRLNQAEEQIRKSKLGDVVRDKFKTGEKQKEILDVLVQKVGKKHEELTPYQGRPKQANPSFMEALLGLSTKKEGDNTEGINDKLLSPKKDPKIQRKPGLDANQLSPTPKISPRGRILDTRRQVGSKERR